ncbi:MAG: formylglycine-generating enzyme family protein [Proteobacteria bacterium]|nr:formylglycine-generating enzyme family protein [Pseudomonadota bacterium]
MLKLIRQLYSLNNNKYKFRLPTEAEWEDACRSGGKPETYSGDSRINRVAWYKKNSGRRIHRVGTKATNGLGLYDMFGNVWEWCEDRYAKDAYTRHTRNNPIINKGSNVVNRGWSYHRGDCRSANRGQSPGCRDDSLGFRLAWSD